MPGTRIRSVFGNDAAFAGLPYNAKFPVMATFVGYTKDLGMIRIRRDGISESEIVPEDGWDAVSS